MKRISGTKEKVEKSWPPGVPLSSCTRPSSGLLAGVCSSSRFSHFLSYRTSEILLPKRAGGSVLASHTCSGVVPEVWATRDERPLHRHLHRPQSQHTRGLRPPIQSRGIATPR